MINAEGTANNYRMKSLHIMATALLAASSLAAVCSCTSKENTQTTEITPGNFVIEGSLPANRFDSACLYLVPMQGPHPRPVDSVFIKADGKFRFEGNVEQIAVLRVDMHHRMGLQDLLVCTESGLTRVVLDSVSNCIEGTPQNQILQQWKDRMQQYSADNMHLAQMRNAGAPADVVSFYSDSIREAMGNDLYDLLMSQGRKTATVFINKMRNGKIDSTRVAELNELLKDTIDWSLPQPGFHK